MPDPSSSVWLNKNLEVWIKLTTPHQDVLVELKYTHGGHLAQERYLKSGRESRDDAYTKPDNVASWMGGKM